MLNIALASYGMSGHVFHAPLVAAHPQFNLFKVLERHRAESADRYPGVLIVKQYEDLLSDGEVDIIVVNTPNEYHFDMTKAALEAGKHVVVENRLPTPPKRLNNSLIWRRNKAKR